MRVGRVWRLPRPACRALTWLVGRRSAAVVLPVCPLVGVVFRSPRARLVTDILARMSPGSYRGI